MKHLLSAACALSLTATLLLGCTNSTAKAPATASVPAQEAGAYSPVTIRNDDRASTVPAIPKKELSLGPH